MYEITIWDGEVEVTWMVMADDRKTAIAKAKKEHYITKRSMPLEIHSHKI